MRSGLFGALEALLRRTDEIEGDTALERVTVSEAAVMAAITKAGRRGGVSGVARFLGIKQPTATDAIYRLEKRGLVHRIVRLGSRSHAVLLTQEGATMLAAVANAEEYVVEQVLDRLSEEERRLFVALLTKAFMGPAPELPAAVSGG